MVHTAGTRLGISNATIVAPHAVHAATRDISRLLLSSDSDSYSSVVDEACWRLANAAGAAIVAMRIIGHDDLAHYVGGWASTAILDGHQPPLRLKTSNLAETPILTNRLGEMPVLPLEVDLDRWAGAAPATPLSLFCPIMFRDQVYGYLCLVATEDLCWTEATISAIATAASLIGQSHARVEAQHSLRLQVDLTEFGRQKTQRFLTFAPGEEAGEIEASLGELGELIGAEAVSYWASEPDQALVGHPVSWLRRGRNDSPDFYAAGSLQDDLGPLLTNLEDPVVIESLLPSEVRHPSDPRIQRDLTWLAVPGRLRGKHKLTLVLARSVALPWRDWEMRGINAFADLIALADERLAVEAQLVASFHDAPLGITLRSATGDLLDCNQAFLDFLGVDNESQLLGGGGPEMLASEELTDEMFHALAHPPEQGHRGLELPYRHASGGVVWGRLSIAPLRTHNTATWLTHVEDITTDREAAEVMRRRASSDELTGLANRHELFDRLRTELGHSDEAVESDSRSPCAVLLMDLNGFKAVNDRHGHRSGDELLRLVGNRLSASVRATDLVGRYGGDEFLVIVAGPIERAVAEAKADQIRTAFKEPFEVGDQTFDISASIGVALANYGDEPEDLIALADTTMYQDKFAGRTDGSSTNPRLDTATAMF